MASRRAVRGTWVGVICKVDDCSKSVHSGGYCSTHLARVKRSGTTDEPLRWQPKGRLCTYVGCGRKHFGKGYCTMHYARFKKFGSPHIVAGKTPGSLRGVCNVIDCTRWVAAYGRCSMHHQRITRQGTTERKRRKASGATTCVAPKCQLPATTCDYCTGHYSKLLKYGDPLGGVRTNSVSRIPEDAECLEDGCTVRPKARGLCKRHYDRFMYRQNTDRYRAYNDARRARIAELQVVPFTDEQFLQKMSYWGNKCWMCKGKYEADDHVKPVNKGGAHVLANFRPACKSCNSRKHDRWYGVRELHRFVKA